jgi:hypothetical protein
VCGAGVKEVFPHLVRVRLAREHARSLGVRAARLARPSHRAPPARCGSVDPPPGKGEEEREEGKGKTVPDKWALPGSERGEGERVWLLGRCGRLGRWAGAVVGPAAGFWDGRPSRGSKLRGKDFGLKAFD